MSYIDQTEFAPAGEIQELSAGEIEMIGGGRRFAAVLRVIDWLGRGLTVKAVTDSLPKADLAAIGAREAGRRPGAGG
jgi:hypothetical protein